MVISWKEIEYWNSSAKKYKPDGLLKGEQGTERKTDSFPSRACRTAGCFFRFRESMGNESSWADHQIKKKDSRTLQEAQNKNWEFLILQH